MINTYTAKYVKIDSGYMGQLVEWPEVVTEGKTLEECREMLEDALHEMIAAYRKESREIPIDITESENAVYWCHCEAGPCQPWQSLAHDGEIAASPVAPRDDTPVFGAMAKRL